MTSEKIHSTFKKHWQEIVENIDTKTPTQQKQSNTARLKRLYHTLRQSKTGEALLDWAEENSISILIDHQLDPKYGAVYMLGTSIILLSGRTNDDVLVSNLAHEIRHAWQNSHGFFTNAIKEDAQNDLSIAYNITMPSLLLEADAFAHQLQVAAELAQKNIKKPWNDLTDYPNRFRPRVTVETGDLDRTSMNLVCPSGVVTQALNCQRQINITAIGIRLSVIKRFKV